MEKKELIKFFSEFWGFEPSKVTDDLRLDDNNLGRQTSIRLYQFFAKVESKFNVKVKNLGSIITFGDLFRNIVPI